MLVIFWFVLVFVLGTAIGSFLNVCIARLPLEKSLLWPNSRCGKCFQPIPWYHNLPLVSYVALRGRCRTCGTRYSIRYFLVELLTGLGFVGLFYLEVVRNVHHWPDMGQGWALPHGLYPWQWWVGFGYHAILFSFLMAAAFCDLQHRYIPLAITVTGTIVGLIGAVLMPWPWPHTPAQALAKIHAYEAQLRIQNIAWWELPAKVGPEHGVYAWPVWGPLPDWMPPGSALLGLMTGLAGILAGTLMLRIIAFLFGKGLGKEALGLGDADLMMMAGAFLGWQVVVVAFFVSVIPGLFFGIYQLLARNDNSLPFGPSLAMGVVITFLSWHWIGPAVRQLFFWNVLLICLAILASAFMLGMSYLLRLMQPARKGAEGDGAG